MGGMGALRWSDRAICIALNLSLTSIFVGDFNKNWPLQLIKIGLLRAIACFVSESKAIAVVAISFHLPFVHALL